jgi:hypothetical protein
MALLALFTKKNSLFYNCVKIKKLYKKTLKSARSAISKKTKKNEKLNNYYMSIFALYHPFNTNLNSFSRSM